MSINKKYEWLVFLIVPIAIMCAYEIYAKCKKVSIGEQAPLLDLELFGTDNKKHTLRSFIVTGKKLALVFYPKDNTPVCTKELCSLRDNYKKLEENDIIVVGVSNDKKSSHQSFQNSKKLPFLLLSDPKEILIKEYGVQGTLWNSRKTFLINEHGIIVDIINDVDVNNHAIQIIDSFKKSTIS